MHQSVHPRHRPLRDRHWLQIAVVVGWFAVAMGIILIREISTEPTSPAPCPRSDDLVPSCGVLLGITPPAPDIASLTATGCRGPPCLQFPACLRSERFR